MAKKIIMLSPFDVLTGNLSGRQELVYGQNDTRAYEAANGSQGAKNYKPRFIGAKRADGTAYFSVRTKSTTVLNGFTRMGMGLTAITAAIKSAVVSLPATSLGLIPWAHIKKCYEAYKEQNPAAADAKTINTYFDNRVRRMLRYKQATYLFHEPQVAGGWTLHNPYDIESADAIVIKAQTWLKFADRFAFSGQYSGALYFNIDNVLFVSCTTGATPTEWGNLVPSSVVNLNWKATLEGIAISGSSITYLEQPVYDNEGAAVTPGNAVKAIKYSTIAPEP